MGSDRAAPSDAVRAQSAPNLLEGPSAGAVRCCADQPRLPVPLLPVVGRPGLRAPRCPCRDRGGGRPLLRGAGGRGHPPVSRPEALMGEKGRDARGRHEAGVYPATPDEAFEQGLEGAYFAHDLFAATKQGRIGGSPMTRGQRFRASGTWAATTSTRSGCTSMGAGSTASWATTRTAASSSATTWPGSRSGRGSSGAPMAGT